MPGPKTDGRAESTTYYIRCNRFSELSTNIPIDPASINAFGYFVIIVPRWAAICGFIGFILYADSICIIKISVSIFNKMIAVFKVSMAPALG